MKNATQYTRIIKAIANEKRAALILLLHDSKEELCVNEISKALKMSQSLTSHQLKYLESNSFIKGSRVGQTVCYELCNNQITKKALQVIKTLTR